MRDREGRPVSSSAYASTPPTWHLHNPEHIVDRPSLALPAGRYLVVGRILIADTTHLSGGSLTAQTFSAVCALRAGDAPRGAQPLKSVGVGGLSDVCSSTVPRQNPRAGSSSDPNRRSANDLGSVPPSKEHTMSVLIRFAPESLTAEQYDDVVSRLNEAGVFPADGLDYEVCFGSGDKHKVSQVWDTQEHLDAFGAKLMPILAEVGIDPGQPEVVEVHNIIKP